jgi:3-hydroxyisobutyrate dehydrogenase
MKLAFLGLEVMGGPMAKHLVKVSGNTGVVGWNRTWKRAQEWQTEKVATHKNIKETVESAKSVCMCVGNDQDAIQVATEAIQYMSPGSMLIDHTTTSRDAALEMALLAKSKQIHFCDAPVSGGETGAIQGTLTIMVGGTDEAFILAKPILQSYGKTITHMGPVGNGQLTKQVNQIAIAGLLQSLAEALQHATATGLDTDLVLQTIKGGAAQSWQMENRWQSMSAGKFTGFGFAVDHFRKDLDICFREARKRGESLPVTALVDQFYAEVQNQGLSRGDTSSLYTRYFKK